jgi:NMD protein affecting ribosome stability and mRNA decay
MGDFLDDYGGYDILGLYEQRDEDRRAQRAKLLTLPQRIEPAACERCKRLEEHAYDLVGQLRVANIKLSMLKERSK